MSNLPPESGQASTEGSQQLLEELQRYAGWLGKDVRSSRLRTSAKSLGIAISSGKEVPAAILRVQVDIKGLGSGATLPLLRGTMRKILAELE